MKIGRRYVLRSLFQTGGEQVDITKNIIQVSVQNAGIGSGIIDTLCSCLKNHGFSSIRLGWVKGNPQAEHFWKKNRFIETGAAYVSSFLAYDSVKIPAKALWLLGEMGLIYSLSVQDVIPVIVSFLDSPEPLLRERAVNALGRIGRGRYRKPTRTTS